MTEDEVYRVVVFVEEATEGETRKGEPIQPRSSARESPNGLEPGRGPIARSSCNTQKMHYYYARRPFNLMLLHTRDGHQEV